jgi:hypothetical protein
MAVNSMIRRSDSARIGDGMVPGADSVAEAFSTSAQKRHSVVGSKGASSIRHPASSIRHPASGIQHPASGIQHPASGIPRSLSHTGSNALDA